MTCTPRSDENHTAVKDAITEGSIALSLIVSGVANVRPKRQPAIGEPKSAAKAADAPQMR